ncbi:adenylate kinase 4 [Dorcoceras hygrometricum]|uniref:Adenylate kinase 4 n=1 Tax=Dorcoceras hygrometricum TaxID=472368 RepID=A0A2Z7D9D5_9LAMI|nr:adenylate kinase 4 [Dorcoceras hygrometricum]
MIGYYRIDVHIAEEDKLPPLSRRLGFTPTTGCQVSVLNEPGTAARTQSRVKDFEGTREGDLGNDDACECLACKQLDSVDSLSICPSTGFMVNDFVSFTQVSFYRTILSFMNTDSIRTSDSSKLMTVTKAAAASSMVDDEVLMQNISSRWPSKPIHDDYALYFVPSEEEAAEEHLDLDRIAEEQQDISIPLESRFKALAWVGIAQLHRSLP